MTVTISGTSGIVNDATDLNYTGTLTGGAGVVNLGSGQVYKDASGNVGYGTSSPVGKLNVKSTYVSDTTTQQRFEDNTGSALSFGGTGGGVKWLNVADVTTPSTGYALAFQTGGSERARIDSSGNLLVGKTNATELNVGNVLNAGGDSYFTRSGTTDSNSTLHVYSTGAAAFRFFVGLGGTVYATNTTISSLSDQRYKENIRDLNVGLDKIMALQPRLFDWKEGKGADTKNARGFIAQEFEQVFPDLIDEWKDPAPEGEEPYKSVRADLIPVLVKAIQEQQTLITALTARITALEGAAA